MNVLINATGDTLGQLSLEGDGDAKCCGAGPSDARHGEDAGGDPGELCKSIVNTDVTQKPSPESSCDKCPVAVSADGNAEDREDGLSDNQTRSSQPGLDTENDVHIERMRELQNRRYKDTHDALLKSCVPGQPWPRGAFCALISVTGLAQEGQEPWKYVAESSVEDGSHCEEQAFEGLEEKLEENGPFTSLIWTLYINLSPCSACSEIICKFNKDVRANGTDIKSEIFVAAVHKCRRPSCVVNRECPYWSKIGAVLHKETVEGLSNLNKQKTEINAFDEGQRAKVSDYLKQEQKQEKYQGSERQKEDELVDQDLRLLLKYEVVMQDLLKLCKCGRDIEKITQAFQCSVLQEQDKPLGQMDKLQSKSETVLQAPSEPCKDGMDTERISEMCFDQLLKYLQQELKKCQYAGQVEEDKQVDEVPRRPPKHQGDGGEDGDGRGAGARADNSGAMAPEGDIDTVVNCTQKLMKCVEKDIQPCRHPDVPRVRMPRKKKVTNRKGQGERMLEIEDQSELALSTRPEVEENTT